MAPREDATMTQTRTSPGQNFQDNVLAQLRDRRASATLYLNNRMALHGRILDFDPYVLLLQPNDGGPIQMIYKSALVSVAGPPRPPGRGGPGGRPYGDRGDRPSYGDRGDRPPRGDRPDRPPYRPGDRPERPPYRAGDRPDRPPYRSDDRPDNRWGERPPRPEGEWGDRPPRSEAPPDAPPPEPREDASSDAATSPTPAPPTDE
jgi:RNA chaperone Hfq